MLAVTQKDLTCAIARDLLSILQRFVAYFDDSPVSLGQTVAEVHMTVVYLMPVPSSGQ